MNSDDALDALSDAFPHDTVVTDLSQGKPAGEHVWECKIGGLTGPLPPGADLPMRLAVEKAFRELTGFDAQFNFSGWGSTLTEVQRAVVEGREPNRFGNRTETQTEK